MRALADQPMSDGALTHVVALPVVGVPTVFETNDARVAAAIVESFGAWRGCADADADARDGDEAEGRRDAAEARNRGPATGSRRRDAAVSELPVTSGPRAPAPGDRRAAADRLTVRIVVVEGDEGGEGDAPGHAAVLHHLPDAERVIVQSPGSVGIADSRCRRAIAWVTGALVDDVAHFRAAVLEALTLALISGVDRHPLHAAAVAHDGRALLLAGPSGAGKSTLTLAAHLAGLDVMSEDRVWIQLAPRLRVWGSPGELRLVDLPPTLGDSLAAVPSTRDGKTKLGVQLPAGDRWRATADRARVCLIGRQRASRPHVERLSADSVAEALSRDVAPGFDRFPERHARVVAALAAPGGWRLVPSADARESVPLLREMLVAD